MRLLRLETSGFKSFCDKISINFVQDGISVIVGPNGCGKSNIVDAIRWTLGEQSAKHLRGASMEDVIFNGSSVRPPVSMAQVTLVFSNPKSDTILKYSEFLEIEVTRRLFRNGESQYLINKTACRLADIRELFMDTGIGGKGYSIIEQGKIDQIITSRAENRRSIIDEAAGIVKFKAKRKEAERKFAATKQNLLRVEDILEELQRQEEILRIQVKRAEKYLTAKARLERLQQCSAATRWANIKKQTDKIVDSRQSNQQDQDDLNTAMSSLEAQEAVLKLNITQQSAVHEDILTRMQSQKERIISLESELNTNNAAIENLEEWRKKREEEIELFTKQIKTIELQITSYQESAVRFNTEMESNSSQLEQYEEQDRLKNRELNDRRTELEAMQQKEVKNITLITGNQNQLDQLKERLQESRSQKEQLALQIKAIKNDEKQLTITLKEQQQQLQQKIERRIELLDILETFRENREDKEQAILQVKEKIKATSQEFYQTENRLHSLEEIIQSHEGYDAATKKILNYFDQHPEVSEELGFLGTLAELVTPPEKNQIQTSAFLNRYFNLLVFESFKKLKPIKKLIDDLETEQLQLFFVDLTRQKFSGKSKASNTWISAKQGLEIPVPLTDSFKTIDTPLYELSAVDLTGSEGLIDPSAAIMTQAKIFLLGKTGKTNMSELFFSRQQEIENIEIRLVELEANLEKLEEQEEDQTEMLNEINRTLKNKDKEITDTNLEIVGLEKDLDAKQLEIEKLKSQLQSVQLNFKEIDRSKEQFKEKIESLSKSIQIHKQEQLDIQLQIEQLRIQIKESESDKQEHTEELQQIRVLLAGLQEKQQANSKTLQRLHDDIQLRDEQLKQSIDQASETAGRRKTLNAAIKKSQENLPRLLSDLTEIETRLKKTAGEIENDKSKLNDIQQLIQKERKKLNGLQEKNHRLEIKLAQMVQEGENIASNLFSEHKVKPHELLLTFDADSFKVETAIQDINELKQDIGGMQDINLAAKKEYDVLKERLDFLVTQSTDLEKSIEALEDSINKINRESRRRFRDAFKRINEKFSTLFPKLFGGGEAHLELTDESNLLESGVEIIARPPGKKLQNMTLLSGGEKALTAIALVFAIFQIKPSPFCLLDEVDAPLDDANNIRFNKHVKMMTDNSQFIIITHNKKTMEIGDALFGVTMAEPGISKIVSVDLVELVN